MSDTIFTNNVTLTDADWFNDLNRLHYTIFVDPATSTAAFNAIKQIATAASTGVLQLAVQAQMEAVSSGALAVIPSVQHYHPGHPKAFARWTSTTTVPISYNVSSTVVKHGTGDYTLRFVNNFSSNNAIVPFFSCDDNAGVCQGKVSTMTVSTCRVVYRDASGTAADVATFYACFFGDL